MCFIRGITGTLACMALGQKLSSASSTIQMRSCGILVLALVLSLFCHTSPSTPVLVLFYFPEPTKQLLDKLGTS